MKPFQISPHLNVAMYLVVIECRGTGYEVDILRLDLPQDPKGSIQDPLGRG